MKKRRAVTRSVIAGIIASLALIMSCAKESSDNTSKLLPILATALVTESTRSYDAMPLIPAAMASSKDSGGSSTSQSLVANDAVPQGATTNKLKEIFAPVRGSVLIGKELVQFGGRLITRVESVIARFPGILDTTGVAYTDNSDSAHPGHIVKVSTSTHFTGGRLVEIWWSNTGTDTLRDGVKMLELDYSIDSVTGNIDGVLFFRYLPPERPAEFALVRVEFKKAVSGTDITRIAFVYVENYLDFRNNSNANAAFFISENAAGVVTVEGGYTVQGLLMPFVDQNVAGGWDTTDQRVYLFNGAGSIATNKAVVNVVVPLRSQSAALDAVATPFANAQPWSLGELFTDGLLYYLQNNTGSYGGLGTQTLLWFLNMISGASLTTGSTQTDLITALNSIDVTRWGTQAAQVISDLKIVTGILNPVYFEKTAFSINLVGQKDTTGLSGATEYDQLQTVLQTQTSGDFTWFTMEELFNLDIKTGASVDMISGHTGIEAWTGSDAAVPTL